MKVDAVAYDHLVGLIYQGALEAQPWQSALPRLRELLDCQVASLVLRPPAIGDKGAILNSVRPEDETGGQEQPLADTADWQVTAYREEFFALDPFVNLPPNQVTALEDVLSDAELVQSAYYRNYLLPVGLFRILGVDTAEPGGMLARLRFSRRRDESRFSPAERDLVARITPHLHRAIEIYARLSRTTSERNIYAGAVDQLSVATIILDERGQVLNTNTVARALLSQSDGLGERGQQLQLAGRNANQQLQEALRAVLSAQQRGETSVVRALRVERSGARSDLSLLIRPVAASDWPEGQSSPCVAVFVSDPDRQESASRQVLADLFRLTPAEANLAILLARGLSLAEVSRAQDISQHTARAQLKSVFAKTGVSRQAELVRLVLKSVASLGP